MESTTRASEDEETMAIGNRMKAFCQRASWPTGRSSGPIGWRTDSWASRCKVTGLLLLLDAFVPCGRYTGSWLIDADRRVLERRCQGVTWRSYGWVPERHVPWLEGTFRQIGIIPDNHRILLRTGSRRDGGLA